MTVLIRITHIGGCERTPYDDYGSCAIDWLIDTSQHLAGSLPNPINQSYLHVVTNPSEIVSNQVCGNSVFTREMWLNRCHCTQRTKPTCLYSVNYTSGDVTALLEEVVHGEESGLLTSRSTPVVPNYFGVIDPLD